MPIRLLQNAALPRSATTDLTSTVGEPSVAVAGNEIVYTGNWYAAGSHDGGSNWYSVDPFHALPPVDGGFCCDQTTIYDPSQDLFIWLLQYITKNGANTLRVAARRPSQAQWHYWDFRPKFIVSNWDNRWFDYNAAALTNQFLYITSNVYDTQDRWKAAVILKIQLSRLASGDPIGFSFWYTDQVGSLRPTLGAKDRMYFGGHLGAKRLRLIVWEDSRGAVEIHDLEHHVYNGDGLYAAPGPDGRNWLGRCDDRIHAGWVAKGFIGFAWTANVVPHRPYPYVRHFFIKEKGLTADHSFDLWSDEYAYAYPDMCPNDDGNVGMVLFSGGGRIYPAPALFVYDGKYWSGMDFRNGTSGPADGKWGDYLTCRRIAPDGKTWAATGYALQGGAARANIVPRYFRFGYS